MIGGVYCPLSPHDPEHRLHSLVEQTQSRLVLVHSSTKTKFSDHIILFNMDSLLINNLVANDANIDQISNIILTPKNIAYIIFTSGSTGTPKAVSS
jgi:fengycin family lipopeptide synthetase D